MTTMICSVRSPSTSTVATAAASARPIADGRGRWNAQIESDRWRMCWRGADAAGSGGSSDRAVWAIGRYENIVLRVCAARAIDDGRHAHAVIQNDVSAHQAERQGCRKHHRGLAALQTTTCSKEHVEV